MKKTLFFITLSLNVALLAPPKKGFKAPALDVKSLDASDSNRNDNIAAACAAAVSVLSSAEVNNTASVAQPELPLPGALSSRHFLAAVAHNDMLGTNQEDAVADTVIAPPSSPQDRDFDGWDTTADDNQAAAKANTKSGFDKPSFIAFWRYLETLKTKLMNEARQKTVGYTSYEYLRQYAIKGTLHEHVDSLNKSCSGAGYRFIDEAFNQAIQAGNEEYIRYMLLEIRSVEEYKKGFSPATSERIMNFLKACALSKQLIMADLFTSYLQENDETGSLIHELSRKDNDQPYRRLNLLTITARAHELTRRATELSSQGILSAKNTAAPAAAAAASRGNSMDDDAE